MRVWYLNIVTAEIFDAELTEDQMSLKESIESLVSHSADNKASKMIGCNVLYMYNDMLKEQFNYDADGSGMALKEIDSETLQKSDEDSKNEILTKDTKESVNADDDENAFKVDKHLQNDVSENINEDETNTKQNNNEQSQEMVEESNEIDSHNQKSSSEVKPDSSPEMRQDDEVADLNIEKLSDNENENNAPNIESPNKDDDSDSYKDDNLVETAEDSSDVDEKLHQFIDLSNEYSDGLDTTEIDDTETDIEQNDIEIGEEIEELSENLTEKKAHVPETNESLSTMRKEPLPFGVCWSMVCSLYEIFVIDTEQNENVPETPIHGKIKVKDVSVRKLGRKKLNVQKTCSLKYFYELVILNAVCLSNYSDVEQLNSALNSVTKNDVLSNSDDTENEDSETDTQNLVKSMDKKEKVERNVKSEEFTETDTQNTETSVDEKEKVRETTKNEHLTETDISNEEKHINVEELINDETKEKETDYPNVEKSIDKKENIEELIKDDATETDTSNVDNSNDQKEKVNENIQNKELALPVTLSTENSIDENGKLEKIINNNNKIKENDEQNAENANDINENVDERNNEALLEGAGEMTLSINNDASGSGQNVKFTEKVAEINKENKLHEQIDENEKAKETNNEKTNNDINANENIKHKIQSLKEFEHIIEQKTNQYYTKIQTLEVLIMKLENQILSEALHKQNHSSTITKLENHVLKLENELLKMNKNYQNLREEADNMSKRQNRYLELAYKQQAKMDYPELPDHSSKNHELISQHQSKLNELAFVIKNQSEMIMHLQKKYESIENQNRQLHQMVMNQTIFMTSIIKTVQDLSEQNLQNQKEIIQLRQKVNENIETQIQKGENKDKDSLETNVIDELDSLLFHNRDEKIVSAQKEIDIKDGTLSKLDSSESLLQKYLMKERSAMELVLDWCPKSTSTCPLCQNYSLIKNNCVPFQFIIWYHNKQNISKQEDVKDDRTKRDDTEHNKRKDEDNTENENLNYDSTMKNIIKQEKLKGDSITMDGKKQELHDSINRDSIKEEELEDDTASKDGTKQDSLKDSSANKQYMSTDDIDGSQTVQVKDDLPVIALSEDKVVPETVTEESLKYGEGFEKYKVLGYDKEGRPVLRMRDDYVEKEQEKERQNGDDENNMTNLDKRKDSDLINDQRAPQEESENENQENKSNYEEANQLSEHLSKEAQATNEEQNVRNDTKIELDNEKRLNEKVQREEAKATDKITNQDLNKNVKEISEDSPNKDSQAKTDEQMYKSDEELNADKKPIDTSTSDKENTKESNIKHDLTKAKETDYESNENTEKNIKTQKVVQGTDDKKAEKDSTSKSIQGSSSQKTKNDEIYKEPGKVKDSKGKNIVDEQKENSQPQKPKQDNTIKGKDKEDSNKQVDKPKNARNKPAEAENKPKERKVPINIKTNVPKQNEPRGKINLHNGLHW